MTVTYSLYNNKCGTFTRVFLRWKGSIFKLVWPDLLIFLIFYFTCSVIYRFALDSDSERLFIKIALYCEKYGTLIPVSFVLGFYVSLVIGRWWAQYKLIPWVDTVAIWVNATIRGEGDEERLIRRSICRYMVLSITQCFTLISNRSKKRFPTTEHLIQAGLLMENEREAMNSVIAHIPKYQTHWIPLVWATTLVTQARKDEKIVSDTFMKTIIDEINKIKDNCNLLLCFDRIRVPLVYTQVVTLAVYSYFFSCIMGRQWLRSRDQSGKVLEELDLIFPVFTILQFLFYIGWLKVAETLVNPFGDDDYDFELNWMVDRHLKVSYSIVDKMHFNNPILEKDPHWEEMIPAELPHTIASLKYDNEPPETSTACVTVSSSEGEIVTPNVLSIGIIAKAAIKFKRKRASHHDENQTEQFTNLERAGSDTVLMQAINSTENNVNP